MMEVEQVGAKLNTMIYLLQRLVTAAEKDSGSEPTKQQQAIRLRQLGLGYEDIAALLGSSTASVTELVSRSNRGKAKRNGK